MFFCDISNMSSLKIRYWYRKMNVSVAFPDKWSSQITKYCFLLYYLSEWIQKMRIFATIFRQLILFTFWTSWNSKTFLKNFQGKYKLLTSSDTSFNLVMLCYDFIRDLKKNAPALTSTWARISYKEGLINFIQLIAVNRCMFKAKKIEHSIN